MRAICRFFALLIKEAVVYALYMCINTFLPAFVVSSGGMSLFHSNAVWDTSVALFCSSARVASLCQCATTNMKAGQRAHALRRWS